MVLHVLDPTNETGAAQSAAAVRLPSLSGRTVGIISNGKEGAKGYFGHLAAAMKDELGVGDVVVRIKSNYSAPADRHIVDEIKQWHAVVTGIGD